MKKRCTALLLFVILILGTVVPAYAEAVQEYPETESGSITAEQEYPGAESGSTPPEQEENSNQEYAEEDSDLAFTENESDPELTEEEPGTELTEEDPGTELTEEGPGTELTEEGPGTELAEEDPCTELTEEEPCTELTEEDPGTEYEEFSESSLSAAADGTYGDDSEIVDDWANCYYRAIVAVDVSDGVITGIDGQGDTEDEWSIDCFQAALNAQKPAVTVKDGKTKLASANYTVTYASGRKNVGTYKVTVRLKGNYSGSKAVSFRIDPKGTPPSPV